jgi:type IV pilus assembly protein PilM
MAKSNAIWGIDIGQCALKALRCVPGDEPGKITADAFDFIEYPKILSQPEADPVELVRDAIAQFLSRNKVKEDRVAISVPGQAGLARFIKLPPVESKKIPDIVRYEARQQIPFALEDVVWDYQQMAGGSEEDGFALETEVGLFAMKREQVYKSLKPFTDAGIEVDFIQLTPLTLYNFVVFDQMPELPTIDTYDANDPPPSTIVVSLGTDTTDLVVTNGYRVWQRNIALGGSNFTKALTKELKLTFTKAEHLKRNALKAEDPKAVFQAMKPVFHDLVTEIQRSISFFQSVDRKAKIGRVIPMGNAMKLRGLQKFLGQSLGYEVVEMTQFRGLSGPSVVSTPRFADNVLSYGVCYGLCLQGLKQAALRTNLIPPEIIKDRMIRAKKPWAVGAVAAVLVGCSVGFFGNWRAWNSTQDPNLNPAIAAAKSTAGSAQHMQQEYDNAKTELTKVREIGDRITGINDRRVLWPEIIETIGQCVPQDVPPLDWNAEGKNPEQLMALVTGSKRIYIDSLDCEYYTKLEDWFADVKEKYQEGQPKAPGQAADASAAPATPATGPTPAPGSATPGGEPAPTSGPIGEGWVIQITGHHYHNSDKVPGGQGAEYVRRTLMKNLEDKKIQLFDLAAAKNNPKTTAATRTAVLAKDLGIGYPVLVRSFRLHDDDIPLPGFEDEGHGPGGLPAIGGSEAAAAAKSGVATKVTAARYDFIVQFCWKETPFSKRTEKKAGEGDKPAALAGTAATTVPKN